MNEQYYKAIRSWFIREAQYNINFLAEYASNEQIIAKLREQDPILPDSIKRGMTALHFFIQIRNFGNGHELMMAYERYKARES